MVESDFKLFEDAIINVYDSKGKEIKFEKLEIKNYCSKYSSSHNVRPSLFVDGVFISTKKTRVTYKCSCGEINTILLYKYLLKDRLKCHSCREDEEKRKWHGDVIRKIHRGERYISRKKIYRRKYDFDSESEEFKENFYKSNLTMDEFNEIVPFIYSVYGLKLFGSNYTFLEHENGQNAKKYRQMIIIDGKKVPFKEIVLKCPLCGKLFSISIPIKNRAKNKNFLCKGCCFNNKIFAYKRFHEVLYQSNFELEFIKRCEENNIRITNGEEIEYTFKGSTHIYKIDFALPDYHYQVELKDNHIWHKEQIKSGKWEQKENAALKFCGENDMKYFLLFPDDIEKFFENL